jgi:glycosyltransferase involved in cell wall biosynthesis
MPVKSPLFSIVIPTRERCFTLGAAIATVLDQPEADLELVVSDNMSADRTQEVLAEITDPRLLSIRAPRRMSMCDHWDYALNHASGEYVIFLGDDDGMMPQALTRLASIIAEHPFLIYCWPKHGFIWPNPDLKKSFTNIVQPYSPRELNLSALAESSVRSGGGEEWRVLPTVYHSAVARSVLLSLKASTGRVFHTSLPDVFVAHALPALVTTAWDVGRSLTIHGHSAASNAYISIRRSRSLSAQFMLELGNYQVEAGLPDFNALSSLSAGEAERVLIADTILKAIGLFPDAYSDIPFGYSKMIGRLMHWWRFGFLMERLKNGKRLGDRYDFARRQVIAEYLRARFNFVARTVRNRLNHDSQFDHVPELATVADAVSYLYDLEEKMVATSV